MLFIILGTTSGESRAGLTLWASSSILLSDFWSWISAFAVFEAIWSVICFSMS